MGKVTVHQFKGYSINDDKMIVPSRKRTAESIAGINGTIIPGTAEEVEAAHVDADGRYNPPPAGASA